MKKTKSKRVSLVRETLRTLGTVELKPVVAGLGVATVAGAGASCTCDTSNRCYPGGTQHD
ncbi:MAG TPA: hypothetical protein VGD80_37460 [Kofleriaceae bacterium]